MTTWRDSIQPATYRGITFHVRAHESEHGRRIKTHEYPQREGPGVEDLGRRTRRYRVDGYLIGEDYHKRRDALIDACESRPVGHPASAGSILDHPYLGRLTVALEQVRVSEAIDEGGLCRVSMTFVEAPTTPFTFLLSRLAPKVQAEQEAEIVGEQILETVAPQIAGAGSPAVVLEATAAESEKLGVLLEGLDAFDGLARDVDAFQLGASQLIGLASSLATAPAELVEKILDTVGLLGAAVGNAIGALYAYELLLEIEPSQQASQTEVAKEGQQNADLVISAARSAAAAWAVVYAVQVEWPDVKTATAARDRLLEAIDTELQGATDPVYQALLTTRARLMLNVPPQGEQLPQTIEVEPLDTLNTILLAYQIDGDLDQALPLEDRNGTRHPGFLPAGAPVEVLIGS